MNAYLALLIVTSHTVAVDFNQEVRPILNKHCVRCHGPEKQSADVRLDAKVFAFKERAEGAIVVPGKPDESLMFKLITSTDPKERMPHKAEPLSAAQIQVIKQWISSGAAWPENAADMAARVDKRLEHWAWQPLATSFGDNRTIDDFITKKLKSNGLKMSPQADRRTLIRRLSFDLHGLPPSPEAVAAFANDTDPKAYENLVDRLLATPHYGERYARHWLDIAHYADTHGFERDRRRPNAWRYRDYVIDAFNDDIPYNRFIQEQIAGDVLWPNSERAVIATGFLAAGPWDYVGQVETRSGVLRRSARSLDLDDMATQVMTSTMGITINCAHCHDHKLDPISQKEYYQLRAVFAGVKRDDREVLSAARDQLVAKRNDLVARINRIEPGYDLADIVGGGDGRGSGKRGQGIDPINGSIITKSRGMFLEGYQPNTFAKSDNRFVDGVVIPRGDKRKGQVPVTSTGITITGLPGTDGKAWDAIRFGPVTRQHSPKLGGIDFSQPGNSLLGLHANAAITFDLNAFRDDSKHQDLRFASQVGYFGATSNTSYADVRVYVDGKLVVEFEKLKRADNLKDIDIQLPADVRFLTLMSTDGGNGIGMDQIGFGFPRITADSSSLSPSDQERLAALRKQKIKLEAELARFGDSKVYAVVPISVPEVRILRRGNPEAPVGDALEPGALSMLGMLDNRLGTHQSSQADRRASLAKWITDDQNPLTPRVIVNRLWHWHFGQGLVTTPSDFGIGGQPPSHPDLLDWLAMQLSKSGGSLKAVHRLILNSDAYKQDSRYTDNARGIAVDTGNRLLWRQNARRIEAEAVRDAVLSVTGKLNLERGGPGFEDFTYQQAYAPIYKYITADEPKLWRRSIYRYIVRTTPNRFMTTLDCPDPANMTPKRLTTTTPLQSLALYNNDFMLKQSAYFTQRVESEAGDQAEAQAKRAFQLAFLREPTATEAQAAIEFINDNGLFALARILLNANEFCYVD